jgi:glutamate decarboxylase
VDILLQYVVESFDRSTKVIDFHYPNELLQEYNWELTDQPQNLEEILMHCQTTLKYAIKTGIAQLEIIKFFSFYIFSIKTFSV